jgi:hypothetical protein
MKIIGGVGVILAAIAVKLLVSSGIGDLKAATVNQSQQFDQEVSRSDTKEMFAALRQNFPTDYDEFKRDMVGKLSSGMDGADIEVAVGAKLRTIMKDKRPAMAQAPHDALRHYNEVKLASTTVLAGDSAELCGQFVAGGVSPSNEPQGESLVAINRAIVASIELAAAGLRQPVHRDVSALSRADATALVAAMRRQGLTDVEYDAFTSGQLDLAPVEVQCQVGLKIARGVLELPADQGDRVTAYIIVTA